MQMRGGERPTLACRMPDTPIHMFFCDRLAVLFNWYQYQEHQRYAHADLADLISLSEITVGGCFDRYILYVPSLSGIYTHIYIYTVYTVC